MAVERRISDSEIVMDSLPFYEKVILVTGNSLIHYLGYFPLKKSFDFLGKSDKEIFETALIGSIRLGMDILSILVTIGVVIGDSNPLKTRDRILTYREIRLDEEVGRFKVRLNALERLPDTILTSGENPPNFDLKSLVLESRETEKVA